MQNITNKTNSIDVGTSGQIPEHILNSSEPVILRGLVNNWELYKAGQASNSQAIDYLKSADNGKPAIACIGRPEIQGRFFIITTLVSSIINLKKCQLARF
ncbi:hypothetical protein PN838_22910 [Psychrosphaera sp. G1-22]|uniref:Cupin-like domain-containing protein n=1 Tax=Psychrosphaera algicola TaxID=3023714 RepID=A0ABT5FIN5_9GAMM|nr:cupin-like domain-containing protein [Psychrosphaera sp. G1-22]MDC2891064.1 hypothetical protein [Psychrosphaera sp. G1-22]